MPDDPARNCYCLAGLSCVVFALLVAALVLGAVTAELSTAALVALGVAAFIALAGTLFFVFFAPPRPRPRNQ